MVYLSGNITAYEGSIEGKPEAALMFGPKALSLPSLFPQDRRSQHSYQEPHRPQPSGQCHFLVLHAGSKEQRCPCQGYQHDRNNHSSVCDCTHAACYHAQNASHGSSVTQDNATMTGNTSALLLDRMRKLEEVVQIERETRESMIERERQSWEREVRVLREALMPFYKTQQDMQQKLLEVEDRLNGALEEQTRIRAKFTALDIAAATPRTYGQPLPINVMHGDPRTHLTAAYGGPNDTPAIYSASEDRASLSAEPMSSRHSSNVMAEVESPRSSGILNLVEFPRPALPRYNLPARMSPPVETEEARSSGFLGVDVRELIQRRKLTKAAPPTSGYGSPSSTATKSPPNANNRKGTPRSLPRMSPPHIHVNGTLSKFEDRAYKKRKHQVELMALDVLADVSAASPVIS